MSRGFDHFNVIARHYDRLIVRSADDPLPAIVEARPGDLTLDVGGGTGRTAGRIAEGGARVILCDSSPGMLGEARAKGFTCVLADAGRLPFPADVFDRVVAVDAFHHFVAPSAEVAQPLAAAEMLRVAKPAGRVIVEEPDIRRRGVKVVALGEKLLLMRSRFLTPEALTALFAEAGADRIALRADHFNMWLVFQPNAASS
jgi:demethylmenaquinone methyltransferase/2-methoxy-6-polyprenyl-1,4-benzoquinol methylase